MEKKSLDGPPLIANTGTAIDDVTAWSIHPQEWGNFLTTIFDDWRRHDVGATYVMNFEWTLAAYMNQPGVTCVHQKNCGKALIVEHNGDVYSCDHYVYPKYRLGNLNTEDLVTLINSDRQRIFGMEKSKALPKQCLVCRYLNGCWGGCPKHRFINSHDGEPGLNYLCTGYTQYLRHTEPYLETIAGLITCGHSAREIMAMKFS